MFSTYPLSEAEENSSLHIASINTESKSLLRLMGFGLVPGKDIYILRNRRGDVVLGSGHSRISLGKSVADKVMVRNIQVDAA